jgi:hypothetical protein
VPRIIELELAGAMVDHLKVCTTLISTKARIKLAVEKRNKEHPLLKFPFKDIGVYFP